MSRTMVLHKDKQRRHGNTDGMTFTTLCGRMNAKSVDGMNIADTDADVTCKFCRRLMRRADRVAAADLAS